MRALFTVVAAVPLAGCSMQSHTFTPLDDPDAADDAVDCDAGCFDLSVPHPRLPMNDAYTGRVSATNSLRPTFVWDASTTSAGDTIEYELEYSRDATFATGVTTLRTAETSHRPADPLSVSFVPPVGARYYWHVRACVAETCSPFSPTRWVNLGRSDRDFNGNGVADIMVGAPGTDVNGQSSGTAYLGLGRAMLTVDLFDFVSGGGDDILGASVGFTDVNADGYADVLVGASQGGETKRGEGYVFLGSPSSGLGSGFLLYAPANADDFGMVVPAGDVNGDGFDDVIVGAQLATQQDSVRSGRAYIYFGGVGGTFDTTPDAILDGELDDDGFGFSIGGGGDVNGDGFADVVVGAYRNDAGGIDAGRAYVYLGGAGAFDTTPDAILTGVAQGDWFGHSVAIAGDVNGDGFADVVIGAP
jgi:hypothetical protein